MTIAISLKVNDGIVLAADSASTLVGREPTGNITIVNVYNNANKVFNLRKGWPVGAITWGAGNIGTSSTSTLLKDFRKRLTDGDVSHHQEQLTAPYTIEDIAKRLRTFIFDENYTPVFQGADPAEQPDLGFIVAGYSSDASMAEEYQIDIQGGQCEEPHLIRPKEDSGVTWNGQPEAISRLIFGFSSLLPQVFIDKLGVPLEQVEDAIDVLRQELSVQLITAAMPFQDAIDLAEFLVQTTINFSRFSPGAQTVGGPIEIAGISKHEGFTWIRRKHYFHRDVNPEYPYERYIRTDDD